MTTENQFTRQVKKGLKIAVEPTDDPTYLNQPVWAINWFNLKNKWLYNLYNLVAAPFVKRVGGRLLFKGYLLETVAGNADLSRKMLLIVSYPDIHHFLDMIMIKPFQIISILRVYAVKDFIFGFTRKKRGVSAPAKNKIHSKDAIYLVHHFSTNNPVDNTQLEGIINQYPLELVFSGSKTGIIQRIENNKSIPTPFFMDGINLIKASDRAELKEFLGDNQFNSILARNDTNYLGIFKREK